MSAIHNSLTNGSARRQAPLAPNLADVLLARLDGEETVAVSRSQVAGSDVAGTDTQSLLREFDAVDADRDGVLNRAELDAYAQDRMSSVSIATAGSLLQALVDVLGAPSQSAVQKVTAARTGYTQSRQVLAPAPA